MQKLVAGNTTSSGVVAGRSAPSRIEAITAIWLARNAAGPPRATSVASVSVRPRSRGHDARQVAPASALASARRNPRIAGPCHSASGAPLSAAGATWKSAQHGPIVGRAPYSRRVHGATHARRASASSDSSALSGSVAATSSPRPSIASGHATRVIAGQCGASALASASPTARNAANPAGVGR